MPLLPISVDYTDKDFDSLRVRLFALIRSVFPEWTDENVSNFGNLLVELFAHVGDVLGFYMDNAAQESRIVTATQRKSLLGLCKLIGFVPPGASAAQATELFTIAAPTAADVVLPPGTTCLTSDVTEPLTFQTLAEVRIPAGATSNTGTVEHSENAQDVFTSTGLANQEYVLAATPYLDGSARIVAADGAYIEKADLLSSLSSDKHFVIVVDQNSRARVRFGNGTNGAVPVGTVSIDYKTGGGAKGNVEAGAIKKITGSFTDLLGNAVQLSVTNPAKAAGGRERMSNALIKAQAPATVRAPTNCVAREDFVINAERLPAVSRALMLTSNQDTAVPENTGHLYVIGTDGALTPDLKEAIRIQVTETYSSTLTFTLIVFDALFKQIDVQVIIYKQQGWSGATLKAAISTALQVFFADRNADGTKNANVDFGANMLNAAGVVDPLIAWSDVQNVVRDVAGVRKIDAGSAGFLLNALRADVTLAPNEFPRLGTVTVVDGDTGLTL